MSAPKKGSNRVKGNLKPSSSSQAAQLIAGQAPGFIGFGIQTSPSFVPLSHLLDDVDSTLDSDIRLILRKLSKKDTTTKIKALQELGDVCQEKNPEVLKSMLPFWPRLYNRLAMDIDHKVREAVQQTFLSITNKVKKEIAPYLKSLMGCWVLSQCDTYPTVSSAATLVFQSTFPGTKQNEALTAYRQDIFDYLVDNIVCQTAQSLSDPKTTSAEDMENKYTRTLAASFAGARKLINALSESKVSSMNPAITNLFQDGKFWKHSKSAAPGVKAGLYSFLAIICQKYPDIATEHISKLAPIILHNIDISSPIIMGSMWEAILSLVNYVPECWTQISWQKAFYPKLRKALETGCYGNASMVAPNIMLLLSKIPESFYPDKRTFYMEFLLCMKVGLKDESIALSGIESAALVKAYIDCCHYIINQALVMQNTDDELAKHILTQCVLELLKSTLIEENLPLYSSQLYSCIGSMMKILEKSTKAKDLVEFFWHDLQEYFFMILKKESHQSFLRISALMKAMLTPNIVAKKTVSLRFDDCLRKGKSGKSQVDPETLSQGLKAFYSSLMQHVYSEVQHKKNEKLNMQFFADMFDLYINGDILRTVLSTDSSDDIFLHFFQESCIPYLKSTSDSPIESENMLIISLKCLEKMDPTMSSSVFPQLLDNCVSLIQRCLVIEKLTEKRVYDANATVICRSSAVTDMIVKLVKDTCILSTQNTQDSHNTLIHRGWSVVTLVLSSFGGKDTVFNEECLEGVLVAIGEELNTLRTMAGSENLQEAIQLVTKAASSFFDNLKDILCQQASEELMVTLFRISIDESYNLDISTTDDCQLVWTKGLKLLHTSELGDRIDNGFLHQACEIVKQLVSTKDCSSQQFAKVLKNMELILNRVKSNENGKETVNNLINNLFIPSTGRDSPTFASLLGYTYISGDLSASEHIPQKIVISCMKDVTMVLNQANFKVKLLSFNLFGYMDSSKKDDHTDVCKYELNTVDKQYLQDICFLLSVSKNVLTYENPKDVESYLKKFDELYDSLCSIVSSLTDDCKKELLQRAIRESEEDGKLNSVILSLLLQTMKSSCLILNEHEIVNRWTTSELTSEIVHTIQSILPFFSNVSIQQLAETQSSVFSTSLSTTNEWLSYRSLAVLTTCLTKLSTDKSPEIVFTFTKTIDSVLEQLMKWREADDTFLVSTDEDLTNTKKVIVNTQVLKFLALVVREAPQQLSDKEWDMVLCCLVDWVHRVISCVSLEDQLVTVVVFVISVADLLFQVSRCMDTNAKSKDPSFPECLWTEWDEFFSEGIFGELIPFYVTLASQKRNVVLLDIMVKAVGKAVGMCNKSQIVKHKLPVYLVAGSDSLLPPEIQTFLNHFCPFLLSNKAQTQSIAAILLEKIMEEVAQAYQLPSKEDERETLSEETCTQSPPSVLMDVIIKGGQAMDVILIGMTIGEQYVIQPNTEEFQFAYGYMLAWKMTLVFFKTADPQMRAKYATYLKEKKLYSQLLRHIFCLLPSERALSAISSASFNVQTLPLSDEDHQIDVQQQAFSLLYRCLETTPALVRQWWMDLDRKTSLYVDKFISKYISPQLSTEEISTVQPSSDNLEGFTIKPRASTREVVATYIMAEVKIVVTITLPENFPLGVIAVSSDKRVGATQAQWDRWLLQLNIFLQHQNGTIIEGLKLWKKNIDKRFDGVEECMICFSVLHGTTLQLPKLQCRTCKKKYHSACLYKWFSTSMKSTCPLCRNLF